MERLWFGVICNCMSYNEEENGVIDNLCLQQSTARYHACTCIQVL